MTITQTADGFRAFIFDFDGVVVDSEEAVYLGWEKAIEEMGLKEFSREYFRSLFGSGARNVATQVLLRNNIAPTPEVVAQLVEKKSEYGTRLASSARLIPDVRELFQRFSSLKFALATGNNRLFVDAVLRHYQLESCFQGKIYAEDVLSHKPDPEAFLLAAERLNVSPSDCLVFEDTEPGIEAAKRAGMYSVAITTTRDRQALAEATVVVDSYTEVTHQILAQIAR